MILAQNRLQLLNGSKLLIVVFFALTSVSCELFKPANGGNNSNNNGNTEQIDEIIVYNDNDRDNDGVIDEYDKCPDVPGLVRLEGCPEGTTDNNNGAVNNSGNTNTNNSNNSNNTGNNSSNTDNNSVSQNGNTDVPTGNGTNNSTNSGDIDIDKPSYDLKERYKVGIIMPFFAEEVSTAFTMPSQAIPGMNFYEGATLALQELSYEGVSLDVSVFDSRRSEGVIQGLIDNYTLNSMDLIIGPASSSNVELVAEQVAKKAQVPLVSLNLNSTIANENPYFIQSSPFFNSHAEATVEYIQKQYNGKKVVMIVPNSGREVSRLQVYHSANKKLSEGAITNGYSELLAEKTGSSYAFNGLSEALTYGDTTVIIAPVSNEAFANSLLRKLSVLKASKPVVVFGMPSWMGFEKIDFSVFDDCNLHVTNGSYIDHNDEKVKAFKENFFNEYGAVPTIEAYKGYDLTLYFGRMLHKYGASFIEKLNESDASLLQCRFEFEKEFTNTEAATGEFNQINHIENKYVHILRFQNYKFVLMNDKNNVFYNIDD